MSNIGKMKITAQFNIGSKPHTKEFTTYALLGKWVAENWMNVRGIRIYVKDAY